MKAILELTAKQVTAFEELSRDVFIVNHCQHLVTFFPDKFGHIDHLELKRGVSCCVERAQGYGLHSLPDVTGFLNLAAALGWHFDTDAQFSWMRNMLLDPAVSDPSDRIRLATDAYLYRQRVEEDNAAMRARFAANTPDYDFDAAPDDVDQASDQDPLLPHVEDSKELVR